jgi:hypothetical protein
MHYALFLHIFCYCFWTWIDIKTWIRSMTWLCLYWLSNLGRHAYIVLMIDSCTLIIVFNLLFIDVHIFGFCIVCSSFYCF